MRLNKISPRWSAPLVSASFMLLVGTVGITSGCGSGSAEKRIDPTPTASPTPTPSAGQTDGIVRVFVNWPSRTGRLAPALAPLASQRVNVVLLDNDRKELTRVQATRPAQTENSAGDDASTSTVIFSPVPAGSYYIVAAAYPDGSNVAQAATASAVPVTVASGQTQELALSFASQIANLAINTPNTGKATTLTAGQSVTLTTTATNAAGAAILTSPLQIGFSSSDPAVATVTAAGLVTAVATGGATITVTDSESGKTAQTTVFVTDQPTPQTQ